VAPNYGCCRLVDDWSAGCGAKMKTLIAGALVVCATIVVVAWAISGHVNNKQDAEWCHENGYTNYATKDGFCVGARGKLIKVARP
jgi:hypothetical protein